MPHDNFSIAPSAQIGPTYPNGIAMQPGDLIYTTATVSTFLVGHIGIVGPDYAVYHSHPYSPKRDSLQAYISILTAVILLQYYECEMEEDYKLELGQK